jgi:hypothetical protein
MHFIPFIFYTPFLIVNKTKLIKKVIRENITDTIKRLVITILYFIILKVSIYLAIPNAFNIKNTKNIIPKPLEAPFISAELNAI